MAVRGNLEYDLKNRKIPAAERDGMVNEAARILELVGAIGLLLSNASKLRPSFVYN
jgi:hypothetical protein